MAPRKNARKQPAKKRTPPSGAPKPRGNVAPPKPAPAPVRAPKTSFPLEAKLNQLSKSFGQGTTNYMEGFYDPTDATSEIRFRVTDYFDSSANATNYVDQYLFDVSQEFVRPSPISGMNSTMCFVESVTLFALPGFSVATNTGALLVPFHVPVKFNANGETQTACQQSTLLTPSSVSNWVKVGSWKAKKLFRDGIYSPIRSQGSNQVLFCVGCFEPDDLTPTTVKVQFRAEIIVSQNLPAMNAAIAGVFAAPSWIDPIATGAAANNMLITCIGASNTR